MRKLLAPFLVLFLTVPTLSAAGQTGPGPDCSPAYPHGIQGTFATLGMVIANPGAEGYTMEEDEQIWAQRNSQQFKQMLSNKTGNSPLQFSWVAPGQAWTLSVTVQVHGRGRTSDGYATAFWGEVWLQSISKKGYLFHFTTHAYEPQGHDEQILQEAVDTAYSYMANGWTCNK